MNSMLKQISNLLLPMESKVDNVLNIQKSHNFIEYTTAGNHTWVCPEGVYFVYVTLVGGGGGGAGGGPAYYGSYSAGSTSVGPSGSAGGGGASVMAIVPVTPGTSYTITVGKGGAGAATGTNGTSATAGGDSKFGTLISVEGGFPGKQPTADGYNRTIYAGGDGGSDSFDTTIKAMIYNIKAGTKGGTGVQHSTANPEGGTGNLGKGAGGAGGGGGASSDSDPTAGSAGSIGYVSIFW